MDGLQWKNPIKMDDLGGKPTIFGNIPPWKKKCQLQKCTFLRGYSLCSPERVWKAPFAFEGGSKRILSKLHLS